VTIRGIGPFLSSGGQFRAPGGKRANSPKNTSEGLIPGADSTRGLIPDHYFRREVICYLRGLIPGADSTRGLIPDQIYLRGADSRGLF